MTRVRKGFTLIELLLAMTALSVLLIAVATTTMQMIHLYSKGITLRSVNQAGRDVSDMIKRDALSAVNGIAYVSPEDGGGLGRLCMGSRSYLWSDSTVLQNGTAVRYKLSSGASGDMIVLARVIDSGGQYCAGGGPYTVNVESSKATELLGTRDSDLAVYGGDSFKPVRITAASDAINPISLITFTIGTNEAGTIDTMSQTCRPPTDTLSNYDFCAINKFEMLIQG